MKDMEEVHKERTENRINYHISDDISHNFFTDGICNFGKDCYYCNKYSNKRKEQKSSEILSQFHEKDRPQVQKYVDIAGTDHVERVLNYYCSHCNNYTDRFWCLWSHLNHLTK